MSARGDGEDCRQALDAGGLILGGDVVDSVRELHRLSVTSRTGDRRPRVRLSHDGASVEFELVHGDRAERDELEAPDAGWRIAHGALARVQPATRGLSARAASDPSVRGS